MRFLLMLVFLIVIPVAVGYFTEIPFLGLVAFVLSFIPNYFLYQRPWQVRLQRNWTRNLRRRHPHMTEDEHAVYMEGRGYWDNPGGPGREPFPHLRGQ